MSKLSLYEFFWDCGRSGELSGLFVATNEQIENVIGKEAYFGEVLGKHSEVYGKINKQDITLISDDSEKVEWLVKVTGGSHSINGFNPLDYVGEG